MRKIRKFNQSDIKTGDEYGIIHGSDCLHIIGKVLAKGGDTLFLMVEYIPQDLEIGLSDCKVITTCLESMVIVMYLESINSLVRGGWLPRQAYLKRLIVSYNRQFLYQY